jgi:3-methyladenine DNA glycosylase Tag
MQAPTQIEPAGLADYLDVITRAVFQSGMRWRVVEAKWDGFRESFAGFDPAVVAAYAGDDVERLAADTRIIRDRGRLARRVPLSRRDGRLLRPVRGR